MVSGQPIKIDQLQAKQIYKYLLKNDYISDDDSITQEYRTALAGNTLEPLPEALQPYAPEVHKLIQAIYDDSILKDMFKDGNQTKPPENPLNERFYKDAFQALWRAINHRYAYTVDFDSDELIRNAIAAIDANLYVSQLQYTVSQASQRQALNAEMMKRSFTWLPCAQTAPTSKPGQPSIATTSSKPSWALKTLIFTVYATRMPQN